MKLRTLVFASLACLNTMNYAAERDIDPAIYSLAVDIRHPTIEELRKIQYAISHANRPMIKRFGDKEFIPREFKFIGNTQEELPEYGMYAVNSSEAERENCIIIYASFNERYPKGVRRLVEAIRNSDYKGHVRYRIGGWPNIEEGDLVLAHVPFAFKPCFFKEAKKMGYKRILWLDASILPSPTTSLNTIFGMIAEKGYFLQGNYHSVGQFFNEEASAAFGITLQQAWSIPSCSAAILGIDFTNPKTSAIIDAWYAAAKHPCAFYSARSDQNALSIIFCQMGLRDWIPLRTLGGPGARGHDILFIMDRWGVKSR